MSTKHSPTPWKLCGGYTPKYAAITSAHGYIVFGMADHATDRECGKPIDAPDSDEQRANAEFIVRAANSFEELVNALRAIITEAGRLSDAGRSIPESLVTIARAAIHRAEAGEKG